MNENSKSIPPVANQGVEGADVSRRRFFGKALRGVALCSGGMVSVATFSMPARAQYYSEGESYVWKSTARYRDFPNGPQHCAGCVHFREPAGCQIVEPLINPNGWCRYFYPLPFVYMRPAPGY